MYGWRENLFFVYCFVPLKILCQIHVWLIQKLTEWYRLKYSVIQSILEKKIECVNMDYATITVMVYVGSNKTSLLTEIIHI